VEGVKHVADAERRENSDDEIFCTFMIVLYVTDTGSVSNLGPRILTH